MCNVFCKEFTGWCKSFTRTERVLCLVQALALCVLIALLVFLTLHLLVCSEERLKPDQNTTQDSTKHSPKDVSSSDESLSRTTLPVPIHSDISGITTKSAYATGGISTTTLSPDVECTWKPSKKTKATTHYYWTPRITAPILHVKATRDKFGEITEYNDGDDLEDSLDGKDAPQRYKNYVAALVKLKVPAEITYGCILTKVTRYWTLTAASCIESIEEVDSLDSFFITETYGEVRQAQGHALADVRIHPQYQGTNRSYDLAALRSADALAPGAAHLPQLPTLIEYFLISLGEQFIILGYGGYRTIDRSETGRRLRQVATYTVSQAQCGSEGEDSWAPRHLLGGRALAASGCTSCGAAALCAGALAQRDSPCAYCGGTPLLRADRLFGVMSNNRHCGVSCEPALYVNIAALRDWIESVVN